MLTSLNFAICPGAAGGHHDPESRNAPADDQFDTKCCDYILAVALLALGLGHLSDRAVLDGLFTVVALGER